MSKHTVAIVAICVCVLTIAYGTLAVLVWYTRVQMRQASKVIQERIDVHTQENVSKVIKSRPKWVAGGTAPTGADANAFLAEDLPEPLHKK